jgi:hypothetical protein
VLENDRDSVARIGLPVVGDDGVVLAIAVFTAKRHLGTFADRAIETLPDASPCGYRRQISRRLGAFVVAWILIVARTLIVARIFVVARVGLAAGVIPALIARWRSVVATTASTSAASASGDQGQGTG